MYDPDLIEDRTENSIWDRAWRAAMILLVGILAGLSVLLTGCDSIPQRADSLHEDILDAGEGSIQVSANGVALAVFQICQHARNAALGQVFRTEEQRLARDRMCQVMEVNTMIISDEAW